MFRSIESAIESANQYQNQLREHDHSRCQRRRDTDESRKSPYNKSTLNQEIVPEKHAVREKSCNANGFEDLFGSNQTSQDSQIVSGSPPSHLLLENGEDSSKTFAGEPEILPYVELECTLKPSFPDSSDSIGVDTRQFILASHGAVKVFGMFEMIKLVYDSKSLN